MNLIDLYSQEVMDYLPEYLAMLRKDGQDPSALEYDFILMCAAAQLNKKKQREAFERQFSTEEIPVQANRWATTRQCPCDRAVARKGCATCGWMRCADCIASTPACPSCGVVSPGGVE